LRGSRCDLLVRSRRTQPGPLAGYPPPGGLLLRQFGLHLTSSEVCAPPGAAYRVPTRTKRSDGEQPRLRTEQTQANGRRSNPMGCSSGSIENAHLIVVPSCGHWSRVGPPPGGPCLERQSRGLSNPQPFPTDSFQGEQALSLQHHLICGADVFHAKRSGAATSGSSSNALFQERRAARLPTAQHCTLRRASTVWMAVSLPTRTTPSRSEPPFAGDSDPLGDQARLPVIGAASQR